MKWLVTIDVIQSIAIITTFVKFSINKLTI